MTVKTEASKSSEFPDLGIETYPETSDSGHITLARALEEARSASADTRAIKKEMIQELERFRAAMRQELKARKPRKVDGRDVLLGLGLALVTLGIAVAFHWSYSLIVAGVALMVLTVLSLTYAAAKS